MEFHVYKDSQGLWRWYLKAVNGKKLANSGEGYYNQRDCLNGIQLVKSTFNVPVYQIQI